MGVDMKFMVLLILATLLEILKRCGNSFVLTSFMIVFLGLRLRLLMMMFIRYIWIHCSEKHLMVSELLPYYALVSQTSCCQLHLASPQGANGFARKWFKRSPGRRSPE
jgi:hypothetical protein